MGRGAGGAEPSPALLESRLWSPWRGGGGGGAHEVSSCHRPGIPSTPPSTRARRCGLWDGGDGRVELAPSPFSSTWTGYFQEKNLSYEALQLPGMCV